MSAVHQGDQRPAAASVDRGETVIVRAEALTNKGDTEDPYSAEEIREKFHEVTGPVWEAPQRDSILKTVDGLERLDTLEPLLDHIAA